jgi:hypothetical protein
MKRKQLPMYLSDKLHILEPEDLGLINMALKKANPNYK